ncbi:MAG: hypothetical protein ABW125_11745 [Candidatus Thiodiazotropha lotti]
MSFQEKLNVAMFLLMVSLLSGCGGTLTVISMGEGKVLPATYVDSIGETAITINLPDGEILEGDLIWIPPGGTMTTGTVMTPNGTALTSGMSSGNKGMYLGTIIGNKGTVMDIEMLCNAFTGSCVGQGKTNSGAMYRIQRK